MGFMKLWNKYKEIVGIISIVVLSTSFILNAAETKKKADKFEAAFVSLEAIAKRYDDPNNWFRLFLLNHGKDSIQAETWSIIPKGPVMSKNDTVAGVPWLDPKVLPDIGIKLVKKDDGRVKVTDTLWNFTKKAK